MRWKETLYERPLRRPIDTMTRKAIEAIYNQRRHEIPVETELHWHPAKPQFTLKSRWLSFHGHFTPEKLVVDAELTLTAKMMATDAHRGQAVRFIDAIAEELGL
jgi:hypothetical protein